MQQILTGSTLQVVLNRKSLTAVVLLLGCILAAIFAVVQAVSAAQTPLAAPPLAVSELEARYGLRLNLLAVTAAGGMVDVRFKIVDAAKAKALLSVPANFPTLQIAGSRTILSIPSEDRPGFSFSDDGAIHLMYANNGGLVKQGTPVNLSFGGIRLEALKAR